MGEHKDNARSAKIDNMKSKIAFAVAQAKQIGELASSPKWHELNAMEQEFYAAENAAWKTVARIVNIRLKIELGRAKAAQGRDGVALPKHPGAAQGRGGVALPKHPGRRVR